MDFISVCLKYRTFCGSRFARLWQQIFDQEIFLSEMGTLTIFKSIWAIGNVCKQNPSCLSCLLL